MKRILGQVVVTAILLFTMLIALTTGAAAEPSAELRNLAAGVGYTWSEQPEPGYGDDGKELTDGKYGSTVFSDPAWVGHLRKTTRAVVFDLGEKKSIAKIRAHFLQDSSVGIAYPNTVSMYVSDDHSQWGTLAHLPSKTPEPVSANTQDFAWDGSKDGIGPHKEALAYARYVKVTFTTDVFVFLDEIEIWGMDGKMNKARPVQLDRPAYQESGKETGGIRNLVLLNNGYAKDDSGIWTKKELTPYISYVNEREEPGDWLFDGILYHGLRSPEGRDFTTGTANLDDWRWYLDKTFAEQGDLQQLNEAVAEAGRRLGDPGHKVKVVLMIPNPGDSAGDFGDVDGDGIPESFNTAGIGTEAAYANKLKAVTWWITQVKERWKEEKYPNLKLNGMYWSSKGISLTDPSEPNLIQATGSLMHRNHLNYYWIPHFQGNRNFDWMDLGFDAALLEPNHYGSPAQIPQRLGDAAELARQYHMGVELEWDERINKDNEKRQQYIDDLNGGADYGYMYDAFRTYDQGESKALLDSARSTDPVSRQNYDFLYQFVMGTYEKPEPCAKKPDGPIERTARQYVVKCGSEITIAHKYNDLVDLWFVFDRFGANKLVSFKEWRLAENTGTDANPDMERPYTLLQGDVSDWIGPYIVRANADGNGHPPSFTGGNHAYDGGNTGSATAVTESVQVWADGVELEEGKVVSSDEVKIRVVNLVQGYNTKLQDGTGRAVLKETVTYEISGGRVRVHNDIEALEDITFETYYGLQTVNGAWNHTVRYYAGDREAASSPANVYSDSGTKALNPDIDSFLLSSDDQGGFRHMLRVQLDRQYGLGTLQHLAEDMPVVFTQNYGKTYFLQIKGTAPELKKGERFSWQGSYDFYSENQ